jgi:hypothetical protein
MSSLRIVASLQHGERSNETVTTLDFVFSHSLGRERT